MASVIFTSGLPPSSTGLGTCSSGPVVGVLSVGVGLVSLSFISSPVFLLIITAPSEIGIAYLLTRMPSNVVFILPAVILWVTFLIIYAPFQNGMLFN